MGLAQNDFNFSQLVRVRVSFRVKVSKRWVAFYIPVRKTPKNKIERGRGVSGTRSIKNAIVCLVALMSD